MYKMNLSGDAHAETVALDDWKVLLQCPRWINSTIHNLGEFMFLDQFCGFCCFSMHFIVMMDLVSMLSLSPLHTYDNSFVRELDYLTPLQIVYLIVSVTYKHKTVPLISLIMIGTVYGLQALVFVLCCKWDMIGWMVFYILAIPIFSPMLPIYSF